MSDSAGIDQKPSLTHQAGSLLIAKVIGFALSVATPLVVVRILLQSDFGLYKQIALILDTAVPLLTLAFYMNAFYFLARRPAEGPKIVLNIVIVHAAVGCLAGFILLAFPSVLKSIFGSTNLRPYATAIAIVLCMRIVGYFVEVVATANQDVGYSMLFIIAAQLTRGIVTVTAALVFRTLQGLIYAMMLQAAVQCLVLFWYLHKRFPGFLSQPDWKLMGDQFRYAVPLGIAVLAYVAQANLHLYVVARRFSPAEYAIYAVGCVELPLIGLLWESVNTVLIPRISYLQQHDRKRDIVHLLANAVRKLGFAYLPISVFLAIAGREFIEVLYTRRYSASWPIFLVNLIVLPLGLLVVDPVLRAYTDQMKFLLRVRVVSVSVMLAAVWYAVSWFGLRGAIVATVTVIAAERLVIVQRLSGTIGLTLRDARLFLDSAKILAAALIAGAVAVPVRLALLGLKPLLVFGCTGTVFSAVYIAVLFLARIPKAEELDLVRNGLATAIRFLKRPSPVPTQAAS
ncbi:MAG: lipopolysaccharide biosynthesis protein [Bryobacteraceae bacterium]